MEEKSFFEDYKNLISSIDNMTKNKEGGGTKYTYTYVDLTSLLEEVLPKIHENNFILIQTVKMASGVYTRDIKTPDGSRLIETPAFVLHSELIHVTNVKVECDMPLYVDDIDPQEIGSSETYMRRNSIYALLHIKTEDDDGAAASTKAKKNMPKNFFDFVLAIYKATTEKQLGAYWYLYREMFAKDSEEYKNLNKFSGNMKLKLGNPDLKVDIFDGVSEIVRNIIEENEGK